MQFCNFCAKNSEKVQDISDIKINFNNTVIVIHNLLNIFQKDIVHFLLDNKDSFICSQCLKKLKKCYEFVQQLKGSELKLQKGKEITSEHDDFGALKVTVNKETQSLETNINFKPILPKTFDNIIKIKENATSNVTKPRLYKCLKCTETFRSFKSLKGHERENCESLSCKEFETCNYCHTICCTKQLLIEHISEKHPQKQYLCCLCEGKSFTSKGYLTRNVIEDLMDQEFNTICEDGSVSEICRHLLRYKQMSLQGQYPEIESELSKLPQGKEWLRPDVKITYTPIAGDSSSEDDANTSESDDDMMVVDEVEESSGSRLKNKDDFVEPEDGWTTVRNKKR